jgi:hypothetical protein
MAALPGRAWGGSIPPGALLLKAPGRHRRGYRVSKNGRELHIDSPAIQSKPVHLLTRTEIDQSNFVLIAQAKQIQIRFDLLDIMQPPAIGVPQFPHATARFHLHQTPAATVGKVNIPAILSDANTVASHLSASQQRIPPVLINVADVALK